MTTTGRDFLVVAPERWDEACFAVPAMRALQATGWRMGVLCRDEQREFWQSVGGMEVLAFPAKANARLVAPVIGVWQAALLWEPGVAADAVKIAKVLRRLGPDQRQLKNLLTQSLKIGGKPFDHRVRFYLSAVEEMGIRTLDPEFFAPVDFGIQRDRDSVLVCPDSDFGPSHEWLPDRWLEIAKRLAETGRRVTVAGLQGGRGLGQSLAKELGEGAEFRQIPELSTVLPLLAAYPLVVAADGSLPHLAAHAGAICVTLFGPNDPLWKRPLGKRHAVLRHHVECSPCLLAKCPLDARCQRELQTGHVWTALTVPDPGGNPKSEI